MEVKFEGQGVGGGSELPLCSRLLFNLFFKDGVCIFSPSFFSFSFL
jgi:hypothetical protein